MRRKEKSEDIDIAFDDCVVDLAKVNVRVKRIKTDGHHKTPLSERFCDREGEGRGLQKGHAHFSHTFSYRQGGETII